MEDGGSGGRQSHIKEYKGIDSLLDIHLREDSYT